MRILSHWICQGHWNHRMAFPTSFSSRSPSSPELELFAPQSSALTLPWPRPPRAGSPGLPATQAQGRKELESPLRMRSWDFCDISCRRGRGGRGAEGEAGGRALGGRPGHGRFPGWPAPLQPPAPQRPGWTPERELEEGVLARASWVPPELFLDTLAVLSRKHVLFHEKEKLWLGRLNY